MKVELALDTAEWVQGELDSGRFTTAEEVLRHAISAAKAARLHAELAAAEAEGGAFTGDEVRRFAHEYLASPARISSQK